MSTLSADNYTGQSATHTLKLAGTTFVGADSDGVLTITGEGGSTKTNVQQGLAKVWCMFNMTGTAAFLDSFNTSTYTDRNTGEGTITFTNNFGNANYSVGSMTCRMAGTNNRKFMAITFEYEHDNTGTAPATDSLQFVNNEGATAADNPGREDASRASLNFFGDLA